MDREQAEKSDMGCQCARTQWYILTGSSYSPAKSPQRDTCFASPSFGNETCAISVNPTSIEPRSPLVPPATGVGC
jgi:hypothetical protein